jgi:hypothetical protein
MPIWDKLSNLSRGELRTLVATTARVILDSEEARSKLPSDFLEISTVSASHELVSLLPGVQPEQAPIVQDLLGDEDSSVEISLAVLKEVRKHPELAQRVTEAYEERTQKLVEPGSLLLTGALVILAIKIEKIQLSKDGFEVTFHESGDVVKSFLSGLVKNIGG